MIKASFVCRTCGFEFEREVLEEREVEDERLRPIKVRCPQCGSTLVERR